MEEQIPQRSTRHRKKKRLRKGRLLLFLLLVGVIGVSVYAFKEYKAGLAIAGKQMQAEPFNGDPITGQIENYLLLGVDSRGEEQSRTDTMMVMSWNKETNDIKLISFMRDIYADIPGYQSYKLNTAYFLGGADLLKETLTNMFGLPIHHYALIDFKSFESLVDILAPNGVSVDVEKDMSEKIGVTLTKGTQQLSGKELLGYARFRQDAEGDFGRVARQQQVIEALKNELITPSNITNVPKLIGAAQGYIATDFSSEEEMMAVLKLATSGQVNIDKATIPIENSYYFETFAGVGSSIVLDVEQNKTFLSDFIGMPLN